MLRKIVAALKAAVVTMFRSLEWVWDGAWRLVLSPLRAVVGQPALQPEEVPDVMTEARVNEILENELSASKTMTPGQSAAKLAAVEAEREAPVEPEPAPSPTPWRQQTWAEKIAIRTKEREERERARGEDIRRAMLTRDLAGLPEEERAVLEEVDAYDWDELINEADGLAIAREVDALVRGYAQLHALHSRLEREGKLGEPQPGAPAFAM